MKDEHLRTFAEKITGRFENFIFALKMRNFQKYGIWTPNQIFECGSNYCFVSRFRQTIYFFFASTIRRSFYYSPFSATTGAIIASGFGYNGFKTDEKDKRIHKWDKVVGVYWFECETVTSPVDVFRYWNH